MGKEKNIENKVKKYLKEHGAYVVKVHGGFYGTTGTPDLLVCYKGKFIGIEMKAPGEEATPIQKQRLRQIKKAGGFGIVADSLDDVKNQINEIERKVNRIKMALRNSGVSYE